MTEAITIKGSVVYNGPAPHVLEWGVGDDPDKLGLKAGVLYDVTDINVHAWHTLITLHGNTGQFNTAYFKWMEEQPLNAAFAAWRKTN